MPEGWWNSFFLSNQRYLAKAIPLIANRRGIHRICIDPMNCPFKRGAIGGRINCLFNRCLFRGPTDADLFEVMENGNTHTEIPNPE